MTATEHRLTVEEGVQLHAEVDGSGAPLVVLHGLGYASWAAAPLRVALRDRFTVWSIDTRGSGRSDDPAGSLSIDRLASDVRAVLDIIGRPVHLLGYSMGGYVAQLVTRDNPHLVDSLTLLSSSAGGPEALDVPMSTQQLWQRHAHDTPETFARSTMPLSFAPGWTARHADTFEHYLRERLRYPTSPRAWRAQYDAAEAFLREGYDTTGIRVPVLIVHGDEDRVVPTANGRHLHRQLSGSRYEEIPGGHLIHLESPDLVAQLFVDFVDRSTPLLHHQ